MGLSQIQSQSDTIVAIASPHGSGIRGIIRLSGPDSVKFASVDFRADDGQPNIDSLTSAASVSGNLQCDDITVPGTLLVWPTKSSFTRQPSVEFHTFGSIAVLELAVKQFCNRGARHAQPGEFTMRAFLSGRLDLTQAEAVLAVIDAKDRKQLDVAIDQLAGGMGSRLDETRDELIAALAELEAGLDFVEEDIEFITSDEMIGKLKAARHSIDSLSSQVSDRDSQNQFYRVGLFGLPNAGKSSLFNCMLGRELAIVSSVLGTTTDRVTSVCDVNDQKIELVDTAGLEMVDGDASIAAASQVQRAGEIGRCDLALLCVSAESSPEEVAAQLQQLSEFSSVECIVVYTQTDRVDSTRMAGLSESPLDMKTKVVFTSVVDASGISDLKDLIEASALESQFAESSIVGSTMIRTEQSLRDALDAVESALTAAMDGIGDEVVASEVRLALDCLGLIVGTVYTDDILDVVFGNFCIGK